MDLDINCSDLIYCEAEELANQVQFTENEEQVEPVHVSNDISDETALHEILTDPSTIKTQQCTFSETLTEMYEKMEQVDVTLTCEERIFKAHKVILCANSPYFRSMFKSGLSEAASGIVNLKGIDPDSLEDILKVMYSGSLPVIEETKRLKLLLSASHMLQFWSLYEYCCYEYMKKLDHNVFLDIWNIAELYENERMLNYITKELASGFKAAKKSSDFLALSVAQLGLLVIELERARHESDDMMKSILDWVRYDELNRIRELPQLFALVDLNRISTNYLSVLLKKEDVLRKSETVMTCLMDAAGAKITLLNMRLATAYVKFVSFWNTSPPSFHYFDMQQKTWSCLSQLSDRRYPIAYDLSTVTALIIKQYLFCIISGTRDDYYSTYEETEVIKYFLQGSYTAGVEYCCTLLQNRLTPGAAAMNDGIYVVGGTDRHGVKLQSVEWYDAEQTKCFDVKPMINPHCTQGVCATNNFLFVVDLENCKVTIERYDPKATQWSMVTCQASPNVQGQQVFANTVIKRRSVAMCAEKLYFVQNEKLITYEPEHDCWMQIKTSGLSLAAIAGVSNPNGKSGYVFLVTTDTQLYQFSSADNAITKVPVSLQQDMIRFEYGAVTFF